MGGANSRPLENQDLTGRVAVVTGASNGLGYETAKNLARMGAHTILACRNAERTEEAIRRMREELGAAVSVQLEFMLLDLSSFQSTKEFTEAFKQKNLPLDILVNNAAVAYVPQRRTQDGFESHYQVNHLGHFLLTLELLPCLKRAAAERGDARVVVVSSGSHVSGEFNPANMNGEEYYSRPGFYGNSKLYNVMFAYSLQRQVKDHKITVSCLHPGAVRTNIYREGAGNSKILLGIGWAVVHLPFFQSPAQAAATPLNCAVNPDLNSCTMQYYKDCAVTDTSQLSRNVRMQKQLWEMSVSAVQEHLSPDILDMYGGVKEDEEEEEEEEEIRKGSERQEVGSGGQEKREERGGEGEEGGGEEGEEERGGQDAGESAIRGKTTQV